VDAEVLLRREAVVLVGVRHLDDVERVGDELLDGLVREVGRVGEGGGAALDDAEAEALRDVLFELLDLAESHVGVELAAVNDHHVAGVNALLPECGDEFGGEIAVVHFLLLPFVA
jgi:hypothetical protein